MKRELKFRGINPYTNEFEYWWPHCDAATLEPNDFWVICTDFQQYTGLKDKNGKDAYEYDIVTWPHLSNDCKYVIYYNEEEAHYFAKPIKHCEGSNMESYLDSEKMVIIGNIHEDKHLLGRTPELL